MKPTAAQTLHLLRGIRSRYAPPEKRTPGWDGIARRIIIDTMADYLGPERQIRGDMHNIDVYLDCMITLFEHAAENPDGPRLHP